jgi:hypothetical protein
MMGVSKTDDEGYEAKAQSTYSRTGQEIGYRSGHHIYSSRDGSILGYCEGQ